MRLHASVPLLLAALCACAGVLGLDEVTYDSWGDAGADAGRDAAALADAAVLDAPISLDGGDACSADLTRDPRNCGACGRSCGDASCQNALCTPELVMSGLRFPTELTAGEAGVFVVAEDGVFACAAPPCADAAAARLFGVDFDGGESAARVALAPGAVVVGAVTPTTSTVVGRIVVCGPTDCATPRTLVTGVLQLGAIAVRNGTEVIWGRQTFALLDSELGSCPLAGCPDGGAVIRGATRFTPVNAIAFGGQSIYWNVANDIVESDSIGVTTIRATVGSSWTTRPLVAQSTRLLWGNPESRTLETCVASNCPGSRATFVANAGSPRTLAEDGSYFYWTAMALGGDGGTEAVLHRCPSANGASSALLARPSAEAFGLAVHGDFVYWSELVTGTVWRVAK